ncbi:MAG: TolC family protein [Gammaproteobacteria bacterium]|nr:TolC family protein [Gammaproteobacteria bacterium]MCY4254881.1 TolC family protein [Gammaproteobacteria bacterium]MCY4341582.1 TolC family protein [Gammaproteobacteria bacterium]
MKIFPVLAAFLVLLAAPAWSQQAAAPDAPYTLREALRDALERDPRIRAAGSRMQEAGEEFAEARALRFPTVNFTGGRGYGYNRNEARNLGIYEGDSQSSGLQVTQTLFSFGRIGAREREASAMIAAAGFDAEDIRQSVQRDVAVAYAEQIYMRSILNRRIEFESLVAEQETSVREQLALGRSDQTQVHEVLRYLHQARAQRIEADTAYRRAQYELARLTGAIRENLQAGDLGALEQVQPGTLEAARARAREEAPIAGKARQSLAVAQSRMEYQRAELWPSLELKLGGSDGYVGDIKTRDADAQLMLRMPIFEGGRKFARARKARYAMEAAEHDLSADLEQLELNIIVSWNLVEGLAQACEELKRSLEDAGEIVSIVEERLLVGRGTVLDQLEAEEIVAQTDVTLLEKRMELAQARVGLLRTLGILTPSL